MQVLVRTRDHEWDLSLQDPGTVSAHHLAEVLAIGPFDRAVIDGQDIDPVQPLNQVGIYQGSSIGFDIDRPRQETNVSLAIMAGPNTGREIGLLRGDNVVGGSEAANVLLPDSGRGETDLIIRVGEADSVSVRPGPGRTFVYVDGARLTGPVDLHARSLICTEGNTMAVRWASSATDRPSERPRRRGTLPFNRPPRNLGSAIVPPVTIPSAPPPAGRPQRFRWATALAPLAAGIAMAFVFSPFMLVFALLSPIMVTANWFEDRARIRRERRKGAERFAEDLARLDHELAAAATMERGRLFNRQSGMPELLSQAHTGAPSLWERRSDHDDFLQLLIGYGNPPWLPAVREPNGPIPLEVDDQLSRYRTVRAAPVEIDLRPGRTLAITGRVRASRGLARNLVLRAVINHGPSDLRIAIVTEPDRRSHWEWAKWLPHAILDSSAEQRLLASSQEDIASMVRFLAERPQPTPLGSPEEALEPTLLVVDLDRLGEEDRGPLRDVMAGAGRPVATIVVGPHPPSGSTAVVTNGEQTCTLEIPALDRQIRGITPCLVDEELALEGARALARFDDPDRREPGADLPDRSRLLTLLDLIEPSASRVLARWRHAATDSLPAPIGETETGRLLIDLVTDGPHGLVAGTTGSGKSELLRTLVASLAATFGPDRLNFVLIDYKGGSAFDACAQLPHTVGLVTDLDAHLGERALVSLEAELRYREARLREAGTSDLPSYLKANPPSPLPRLVVIVDEFAALAKELPAFVASLVDIAQRGRSLGVHLLLATQRPGGVVSENIRANTNLRIALRVQDRAESVDMIGDGGAAAIGRRQPGRAFLRMGPAETFPFQAALVTGSATDGVGAPAVEPFLFGFEPDPPPQADSESESVGDLEKLVRAVKEAHKVSAADDPRRPWLKPLPSLIGQDALPAAVAAEGVGAAVGLLDDPYHQAQREFAWHSSRGNLLIYGANGSGTTTTLLSIATRLASAYPADELHLYGIDFDSQRLQLLRNLPHTGGVVGAEEPERQRRLVRVLRKELESRRRLIADGGSLNDQSTIVLFIDEYGGMRAAFDDAGEHEYIESLHRLMADGPMLGIFTIATAKRATAFPTSVASTIAEKLVMNLADPVEFSSFGIMGSALPSFCPGRAVNAATGHEVQIAEPLDPGQITTPPAGRAPHPVNILSNQVKLSEIIDSAHILDETWFLPVGIGDNELEPVGWSLGPGDGVLVAGNSRSGRSTALVGIAATLARHRPDIRISALTPRPSPLREVPSLKILAGEAALEDALEGNRQRVLLIDDAEFVADESGIVKQLLTARHANLWVIAAGRSDMLRSTYGHWTSELRRSRTGMILDPAPQTDGDLFQVQLPRDRGQPFPPGRGYLVNGGAVELFQAAQP